MKHAKYIYLALAIVFASLIGGITVGLLTSATHTAHSQAAQNPTPSPTPVNQQWKVEYGEISELEIKLHEMNKLNQYVNANEIHISTDGKRYVIVWSSESEYEDDDSK